MLSEQVSELLGPRLSLEAAGGRSIVITLDDGAGGSVLTVVAPLPRLTGKADLLATARNMAQAVHTDVRTTPPFAEATTLGPRKPSVTHRQGIVQITFFDGMGAALALVQASVEMP